MKKQLGILLFALLVAVGLSGVATAAPNNGGPNHSQIGTNYGSPNHGQIGNYGHGYKKWHKWNKWYKWNKWNKWHKWHKWHKHHRHCCR